MIEPAVLGAVAVIVKDAVPFFAIPFASVTLQVSNAPAPDGKGPQLTDETPEPLITAVATTPAGSWSLTVAEVPVLFCPEFPSVIV